MLSITASLDDGSTYDFKLIAMLDKYNIETTMYLPVNWQKYLIKKGIEPMSLGDAKAVAKRFTIGSHGVNHELLTRVDEETQNKEIYESREKLQDLFKQPITSFCFPRGYYDKKIIQKVRDAGYKSARTVMIGSISAIQKPYERMTSVHMGYDRAEYGTDWLTYANALLDRAIQQSSYQPTRFHVWGHGSEIMKLNQWDRVIGFLKRLSEYA